jgi:hypothetical protein
MRCLLFVGLVIVLAGYAGDAFAYACNNRYYVNVSGHLVHSPSCEQKHRIQQQFAATAVSVPQNIIAGHARIMAALPIGIEPQQLADGAPSSPQGLPAAWASVSHIRVDKGTFGGATPPGGPVGPLGHVGIDFEEPLKGAHDFSSTEVGWRAIDLRCSEMAAP